MVLDFRARRGHYRLLLKEEGSENKIEGNATSDDDDVVVGSDAVIDESDEELSSPKNSDDEVDDNKVFNPAVDFKSKIELYVGLKFPSHLVFRKAM